MRVHITLDKELRNDPEAKGKVLDAITDVANVADLNRQRFERYGIISGDVAPDCIDDLRQVDGVAAVEADGTQRVPR